MHARTPFLEDANYDFESNDEMTHVISVSTSISGVSLAYHIPETGTVTCLFFLYFSKQTSVRNM